MNSWWWFPDSRHGLNKKLNRISTFSPPVLHDPFQPYLPTSVFGIGELAVADIQAAFTFAWSIIMAWLILAVSTVTLYWIYDGYGRFLQFSVWLSPAARLYKSPEQPLTELQRWPDITVLLTVHNEEDVVVNRIHNLLACDYPPDSLTVLVASDGSTDNTNALVLAIDDPRVVLFESPGLGKTGTQNKALNRINSEIVLFTDADLEFETNLLHRIAAHMQDPSVGAVDGRLLYSTEGQDANNVSQGFYWNYEMKVRHLESQLGWLAVVAGACFAVRRELIQTMDPSIGEDCIVPLDVALQGYRIVHDPLAIAYINDFGQGSGMTLRRRIRQTLRNWQGTWSRPALLNPFRHPCYALALWSHKLLRWLSPVFLLVSLFASCWLLVTVPGAFSLAAAFPYIGLFTMAGLEPLSGILGRKIPGTGFAFSFLLANTAFLVGIVRATMGSRVHAFKNT